MCKLLVGGGGGGEGDKLCYGLCENGESGVLFRHSNG